MRRASGSSINRAFVEADVCCLALPLMIIRLGLSTRACLLALCSGLVQEPVHVRERKGACPFRGWRDETSTLCEKTDEDRFQPSEVVSLVVMLCVLLKRHRKARAPCQRH